MSWKFISKLEIHDRQVHASPDGTDVINTYYVEPASAGCVVISALLGAVLFKDGLDEGGAPINPTQGHRVLPAKDAQYPNCYCVDAYETMIHPMQPIGTATLTGKFADPIDSEDDWDSIRGMLEAPIVLNGPESLNDDFTKNSIDPNLGPRPGVYVRAVFRPLITNYKYGNPSDADYPAVDVLTFPFDYIDLRINPMSRIIPASAALYGVANTGFGFGIAAQGAAEQVDSWLQITIRRVMCPNIPTQTLAVLKNRINGARPDSEGNLVAGYTPACFTVPGLNLPIPQLSADKSSIIGLTPAPQEFPIQTFRFDDAVWEKKVIQSCIDQENSYVDNTGVHIVILQDPDGIPYTEPMTWWNGELMFSWRTVMDNWYPTDYIPNAAGLLGAVLGVSSANYGWVTWNCDWLPGGMGIDATALRDLKGATVAYLKGGFLGVGSKALKRYPTGWYELASWQGMVLHGDLPLYDLTDASLGLLYLQRKYWDDNDIRLRGGNASNWNDVTETWNTPGFVNINADMLPLLQNPPLSTNSTPFDLLFRIDAP